MFIYTILGASGFVGRHLVERLNQRNEIVQAPKRDQILPSDKSLGHVIFCIGYTSDFRQNPLATADAHVSVLLKYLNQYTFDSFLYLSSTRVYIGAQESSEIANLTVNPNVPEDIFNLTKLAGEACCLSLNNPKVRIARLSNVLGDDFQSDNFVYSLLREAKERGEVKLRSTLDSAKDYISIADVTNLLLAIAENGRERLYNVASGTNTENQEILNLIAKVKSFSLSVVPNANKIVFPAINVTRIQREFSYKPQDISSLVMDLSKNYFRN